MLRVPPGCRSGTGPHGHGMDALHGRVQRAHDDGASLSGAFHGHGGGDSTMGGFGEGKSWKIPLK